MDGICTLANDRVYEQLIALLNSIEVIFGSQIPVCVYPYDDNTEKIAAEIAKRPNVELYDDRQSIERWDKFAKAAWDLHPTARQLWHEVGSNDYHRFGTHRRYCAFDGPFERFFYLDADTLLMGNIQPFFAKLEYSDCVVYNYQYKNPEHVYNVSSSKLTEIFLQDRIFSEIFCSGGYASKQGLFNGKNREWLLSQLESGEAEILYPMAPDQTLLNYMMMRTGCSIYNFALNLSQEDRVGDCVTDPKFTAYENILYDKGKRLNYLHYIGLPSSLFNRVCAGENIDFPYRDIFLYYRYLSEPEKRPQFKATPKWYKQKPSFAQRIGRKLNKLKKQLLPLNLFS